MEPKLVPALKNFFRFRNGPYRVAHWVQREGSSDHRDRDNRRHKSADDYCNNSERRPSGQAAQPDKDQCEYTAECSSGKEETITSGHPLILRIHDRQA